MKDCIDIVNERDEVIGKKFKDLVHQNGDWHRVVHVWVFNSKKGVLIHKRAICKKMFPGFWDTIIGGHLNSGESYEEAAKRELAEEVGIKDYHTLSRLGKWQGISHISAPHNREFIKIFALKYDGEFKKLKPQKSEISEIKFIGLPELIKISKNKQQNKKFISFGYFYKILPKIRKFLEIKYK